MNRVGGFDAVLAAFNEAALDSSRWVQALDAISRATGSFGSALLPMSSRSAGAPHSESLAEIHASYVKDGWIHQDARYQSVPIIKRHSVATELDFISEDQLSRHPYWMEWLAPHKLRWFAGVKISFGEDLWVLSIQRSIAQGPILPEEATLLARLSPHFSAAGALAAALGHARLDGAMAAFQASSSPVLFLDGDGLVIHINEPARKMLNADLQISLGRIVSYSHEATDALGRAIEGINHAEILTAPAIVALPRRGGQRPLLAYLSCASRVLGDVIGSCRCFVTLIDPDERVPIDEKILRTAFGLSPSEARFAARLTDGGSVEQVATQLGLTYQTGRTHLKAIFAKLGVRRQAELASLLSSLAERGSLTSKRTTIKSQASVQNPPRSNQGNPKLLN